MEKHIVYIDILRVIAIVLVILFHFLYNVYLDNSLRYIGFAGISLFFIISGFLLAKKYPRLINFSLRWFVKRYVKIAVFYLLSMLAIAFLFWKQTYPGDLLANILVHLTFLDPFFPQFAYSLISPAWFLVPLICLYLVFPYLNRFIKKDARLLVVPFIAMAAVRIYSGALTSYSPLFFIGEFCFGIAFAYDKKNVAVLASLITVLVNPIMFLPFAAFYVFSFFDFKALGRTRITSIIAANIIVPFLLHEAFFNIIFRKWTIYNTSIFVGLAIFLMTAIIIVYLSQKATNYILSRSFMKLNKVN
ncbi:MAG: acyltransferase family protein [Candidatus Aenigmarchaeota archaeon]|nr:acyltransferase family protein [Candidatus Aenigmarchaeota archaeon]